MYNDDKENGLPSNEEATNHLTPHCLTNDLRKPCDTRNAFWVFFLFTPMRTGLSSCEACIYTTLLRVLDVLRSLHSHKAAASVG